MYKCSDICSSSETRTSQMKVISGTKTSEDGNRVKEKVKNRVIKAARENPTRMTSMTNHENPTAFCGGIQLFKKGKYLAWGHRCRQCGRRNHFASECKKPEKRVNNISSTDTPSSSMDDNENIDCITSVAVESESKCSIELTDNNRFPKEIYTEMLINDKPIKFQIDFGSSTNILTKDVVDNYVRLGTHYKNPHCGEHNGSHATRHCKNHYHESSKPQEVICKVCRSDGKTNPFIRSKSRTTQEASDDTLE